MASVRIALGCGRSVSFALILSFAVLGGSVGCQQMPTKMTTSRFSPGDSARAEQRVRTVARTESLPVARAQTPSGPVLPDLDRPGPASSDQPRGQPVVDVEIKGARQTPAAEIQRQIHTRRG